MEKATQSLEADTVQPKQRLLLVEDNPDVIESLSMLLELFGYYVQSASDGPQGLVAAQQFKPHVILLDIGIPGMDGYELAGRIRATGQFEDTLIVALSGYGQTAEDEERAVTAGIDHYLVKPAEPNQLRSVLSMHRTERKF